MFQAKLYTFKTNLSGMFKAEYKFFFYIYSLSMHVHNNQLFLLEQ